MSHLGVVLLLTLVYFCLNVTSYGLGMFMPAIIKSQSGAKDVWASVLASMPYWMALLGMLLNGWHSDKTGERVVHIAVPFGVLGSGHRRWRPPWMAKWLWPVLAMIVVVGLSLYTLIFPLSGPSPRCFWVRLRPRRPSGSST